MEQTNRPKTNSPTAALELIPRASLEAVGNAFTKGAARYGPHNWRKATLTSESEFKAYIIKRWRNAETHLRKWVEEFQGLEPSEIEDGLPVNHLAKVAWFCLITLELLRIQDLKSHDEASMGADAGDNWAASAEAVAYESQKQRNQE